VSAQLIGFMPFSKTINGHAGFSLSISVGLVAADGTVPSPADMAAFTWQAICRNEPSSSDAEADTFSLAVTPNNANATLILTATPTQTEPMEAGRATMSVWGYVTGTSSAWLVAKITVDVIRVAEYNG
jgi:hypothetical protein